MLCFFPRDVLDEIWDLIESVSEGFPSYSFYHMKFILFCRVFGSTAYVFSYTKMCILAKCFHRRSKSHNMMLILCVRSGKYEIIREGLTLYIFTFPLTLDQILKIFYHILRKKSE